MCTSTEICTHACMSPTVKGDKHLYSSMCICMCMQFPLHKHINPLHPAKCQLSPEQGFLQTAASLTSSIGCRDCHVRCVTLTGSPVFPRQLMHNVTYSPGNIIFLKLCSQHFSTNIFSFSSFNLDDLVF